VRDTILTIDDVEPGLAKAVVKHSERLGRALKGLVLIDTNPRVASRERVKDKTGLFKEIRLDFSDSAKLQAVMKKYNDRLLAVTCRRENSMSSYRKILPFLPYVNTPSESALLWSTEKHLMRDRMRGYDKNMVPKYRYLQEHDLHEAHSICEKFNFPVIVKPTGLAASILVSRCNDKSELQACLMRTFQAINDVYARELGRGRPGVLVEEMIRGDMYSTDAYVNSKGEVFFLPLVRVITADSIGLEGFYSHSFVIPTRLAAKDIKAAQKVSVDAIRALNLASTTTHIELFCSPEGWKIIEVGARIGGYREALYREAYGVDHYYNDLAIRMDEKPIIPAEPIGHATSFNIYSDEEGFIEEITGLEEARQVSSLVDIKCYAEPGDLAFFAGNGGRFIVDGTLSNKDPHQLNDDLMRVRKLINIKVRPETEFRPSLIRPNAVNA
jgi:hypothetical protein